MRKSLLFAALLLPMSASVLAETVTINGKEYTVERKIERQIGPGTTYLRLRLPDYPLNVNVLMVDLNDPYNRIETTIAKESSRGTESLVTAANRQSYEGHRALGGANANFWIVATQPEEYVYTGITRNASVRNGKMITESNQHRDQWDGGTMRTGVVSVSYDKVLNIDYCTSSIQVWSDKFDATEVWQCNKGVWEDEMCMYNSAYGATTAFMPIYQDANGKYQLAEGGDATEVILDFDEGGEWTSGTPMTFVVKEVRLNAGKGSLGNHDLALVGRGDNATLLANLVEGDKVNLNYTWTYNPGTELETSPLVEQAVGGNALVMCHGELTAHNTNETYNSQVYSRTGYGCSEDGKTLYIIVIDKSSDPVYGSSAGCSTTVMCNIAQHLGCYNLANFDAGGSAEMLIDGAIINKTTEGSPRAVANGWIVYSIAPEDDNTVASLQFYDNYLEQPIYSSSSPGVIAYNKYGAVIDYDFKDFTLSCESELGTCEGNVFNAASAEYTGMLTATYGDISVSKEMHVVAAEVALRSHELLIDNFREYPVEVVATASGKEYTYNPAYLSWTVDDTNVVSIDADGIMRGVSEGTTAIKGQIGEFSDQATVTAEFPTDRYMPVADYGTWAVKGASGITNVALDEQGNTTLTYGSPRSPYIEFSLSSLPFYSLPDDVEVLFTSPLKLASVTLTILAANATKEQQIKLEPEEGFAAETEHRLAFNISEAVNTADLCVYPIKFKRMRFTFDSSAAVKGDHVFTFGNVYGVYNNVSGVDEVTLGDDFGTQGKLRLSANPVEAGATFKVAGEAISEVSIYSVSGALVSTTLIGNEDTAEVSAPAVRGAYVVAATCGGTRRSAVLIVR